MNIFTEILAAAWTAFAALVFFSLFVIKHIDNYKKMHSKSASCLDAQTLMEKITETASSSAKAGIFMELMEGGYVLIHKQVNEGSKYNDEKQEKRFERALSDEVVKSLNRIEGKAVC